MMRGALAALIALAVMTGVFAVIAVGVIHGGVWRWATAAVTAALLAALMASAVWSGNNTQTQMEKTL